VTESDDAVSSDECFIPYAADRDRSLRILEQAAAWYGGTLKVDPPPDPDQP
jgi:hypothetical protein